MAVVPLAFGSQGGEVRKIFLRLLGIPLASMQDDGSVADCSCVKNCSWNHH
jgi:hypothetical protein